MKRLIIATATILTLSGATFALNRPQETLQAEDKSPLITQVENHEERISDLETKTDATQTQVNQNTADIGELQTHTNVKPAPQVQAVVTPVTKPAPTVAETVAPAPQPQPAPDPRTITSVTDTPGEHEHNGHTCTYTIVKDNYPRVSIKPNGIPCLKVGDILP